MSTATSRRRQARVRGSSPHSSVQALAQARGQEDAHRHAREAKQALHTGGPAEGCGQGEQGRGAQDGGGEPLGKGPGAGRTPLTYFAKKDFCSWGFLAFWACSISKRSMKAAVSGLWVGVEGGEGMRGRETPQHPGRVGGGAGPE